MSRAFTFNGPTLVAVKGNVTTAIGSTATELGLSQDPIRIIENFMHDDVKVDAWGRTPPDIQYFGSTANISMNLVHIDRTVLDICLAISQAGSPSTGTMSIAGKFMGFGAPRFTSGWNFISLNLTSPVAGAPLRFLNAYLTGPPVEVSIGSERSVYNLNWRAICYTPDPYQGGLGLQGQVLFDNTLDT